MVTEGLELLQVLSRTKAQMEVLFEKNRVTKDDPSFQYDITKQFNVVHGYDSRLTCMQPVESSGWDDEESEDEW